MTNKPNNSNTVQTDINKPIPDYSALLKPVGDGWDMDDKK